MAGGDETFATPQAQGIGRQQAGVTDGKVDPPGEDLKEDSKTELELYRGVVQQLEARLQELEDRLGPDGQPDNESVGRASSGAPPAASDQGRRLTQAEARDLHAFCTRPGCSEPVWSSAQGELYDYCSRTCGKATGPKKLARSVAAGSTAEDPLCPDDDEADALSELGFPDRRAAAYFPKYVIVDPATNNVQWTNQTVQRHVEAKPPLQRQYALDVLVLYELLAEANAMAVQAGAPITRRDLDPIFQVVARARERLGAMVDAYAVFKTTNADDILTAGSVFIGPWTPESLGDYCSGTNHVLPTNGYARTFSGLSVTDFLRRMTLQRANPEGLRIAGPAAMALAAAEGLEAHRMAVAWRLERMEQG